MYSRGRDGLRNLDVALEALRQGALKESRATRAEVKRSMLREDVRRQNRQQRGEGGDGWPPSSSAPPVDVHAPFTGSGLLSTSRSVGTGGNDTTGGMTGPEGLPAWYDGYYAASPGTVEREPWCRATTPASGEEEEEECSVAGAIEDGEEGAVVVDVSQRVSQAERTLYPVLLAEVAACATADAESNGGSVLGMGSSEVIEWDERGAPVRLRGTWQPVTPQGLLPVPGAADERRESVGSGVVPSGRTSAAMTGTTTQFINFDARLSGQPCEYTRKENPLKPTLIGVNQPQGRAPPSRRRGSRGASDGGAVSRTRQIAPSLHGRANGTRGRRRPPLSTEGSAVAESSAGAIAGRIRQAVLQGRTAQLEGPKNGVRRGGGSPPLVDLGLGARCHVAYAPDNVECVVAHVLRPVTAFFCSSCGACAARDVVTGHPSACAACGAAFEEISPPRQHACLMDTVAAENENIAAWQEAGASAGPPTPVRKKKCTTATSTMTPTTTNVEAGRSTAATGTGTTSTAVKVAAGTQAGPSCRVPPLAVTAVQGVYFLHLWDLATAAHHK
ncbi:uncharacterized protein Tco025E_02246 [Trypanosoma conorhini]|uniref:Uncharacterized protein n=1 Tax=Trypanosoma conorhini TaxID=83891 RepID=A0A422Q6I3_9TRYP|nr:uncharacterized protein Tco025E_02246 [Trypanosoma conorhini]RNF25566.1 hypothetical protein Tco025E_02246 [Trypanosoma conorhini]